MPARRLRRGFYRQGTACTASYAASSLDGKDSVSLAARNQFGIPFHAARSAGEPERAPRALRCFIQSPPDRSCKTRSGVYLCLVALSRRAFPEGKRPLGRQSRLITLMQKAARLFPRPLSRWWDPRADRRSGTAELPASGKPSSVPETGREPNAAVAAALVQSPARAAVKDAHGPAGKGFQLIKEVTCCIMGKVFSRHSSFATGTFSLF